MKMKRETEREIIKDKHHTHEHTHAYAHAFCMEPERDTTATQQKDRKERLNE